MSKKRQTIKNALLDRKVIRQVYETKAVSKIRDMLTQAVSSNGNDSQLTAQQVRKILGVQIPGQPQNAEQVSQQPQAMTQQQIRDQNSDKVDRNKAQRDGIHGQDSRGVIHEPASVQNIQNEPRPPVQSNPTVDSQIKADPADISRQADKLKNATIRQDDPSANAGDKSEQIQGQLRDARSEQIKTSTQQNIDRAQKEKQRMLNNNNQQEEWIKQSIRALQSANIYQDVGLQQEPGRPGLDIIDQTFLDQQQIPIQGVEAKDKIEQPSAQDQGIDNFLKRMPEDPNSNMRVPQTNSKNASQDKNRQVPRQIRVQGKQQRDVEKPQGTKILKQDPKLKQIKEKYTKMAQQYVKLRQQNQKLKTFVNFTIKNYNKMNQGMVMQLREMINKSKSISSLKQRYSKCNKLLIQKSKNNHEKKLFESNSSKFNNLRKQLLKNKANASETTPQLDRMRQLAGV